MKQKIRKYMLFLSGIPVILTAVLGLFLFHEMLIKHIYSDLSEEVQVLCQLDLAPEEYSDLYRPYSTRLTVISEDGAPLFDSHFDIKSMENLSDRKEIKDAIQKGEGFAERNSTYLKSDMFFYAAKMDNGLILRIGKESSSVLEIVLSMIPIDLLILVVTISLCWILSIQLTKRIVSPIEHIADNLNSPNLNSPYKELTPFTNALQQKNIAMKAQMDELADQQRQVYLMMRRMSEGFILINQQKALLSLNDSARSFLALENVFIVNKPLSFLSNYPELFQSIEKAFEGENAQVDCEINGRILRIMSTPVFNNEDILTGATCFLIDITEQKKAEEARRAFTANVSHELKTPITSIRGYSEMIAAGLVLDADVKKFASAIEKESLRLLSLVSDILTLSQLDEKSAFELHHCDLLNLARDCLSALSFSAQEKNVTLNLTGDHETVLANPSLLYQMIYNLCDNAIRYNKPGGKVDIEIQKNQENVVFSICDTGVGIPQEHLEHVFERFYRIDKSRSKTTGGTGLGLAIVKHSAEMLNAKIDIESKEGSGTCIRLLFPENNVE